MISFEGKLMEKKVKKPSNKKVLSRCAHFLCWCYCRKYFLFTLVPDVLKDKYRDSLHEKEQNKYVWANE